MGVEQLVPRYSPRLLDVRVLKAIPNPQTAQKEPLTRDYRYKWQYNVRGKFTMKQGVHKPGIRSVEPKIRRRLSNIKRRYMHQRVEAGLPPYIWGGPYPQFRRKRNRYKWQYNVRGKFTMKQGVHKPGIRSVEPKIRRRLSNIKRRYMHQRVEAGLPPYIWGGPYPQFRRKRNRLIKAEMNRRALIYSLDEQRRRAHRLRRRRQKQKWGVYKIDKEPKITAITALPSYHPLTEGNLPK
ncbi:unnamed protein product [Vitrella brassicaformis CCMP3155]|uniref:Uncharacterized protein n=1 Tax=Vitrella brassicaformis (strain CCMP3155) TaxID=1169540 RepID=A0A0G4EBV3_VITBC|nr:unnamed protein product [Vitrella brassicaformis CCMP3155]|eukprot:CEL93130.1 unnamed protein product [Vitrella brassicaformis CCMP3155]